VRLTIEKLVYGGDGLARVAAAGDERRGKAVFAPYVLPGEVVEASIVEERKGFARASLVEVLAPSAARVAPRCPYFGVCGGCHYQHANYAAQLEAKQQILQETILRGAKIAPPPVELHSGPEYGYRNRTRMKFAFEPDFALGYYRHGSHELEPVRQCPISSPLINRAIAEVWELADEARKYPALREVQFFVNHDDSRMLVELFAQAQPAELKDFARLLRKRMPEIAGVVIYAGGFAAGATAGELDDSLEVAPRSSRTGAFHLEGVSSFLYELAGQAYRVSAGSFFQTNRFLAEKLVELATAGRSGRAALDLYAGVGLFTLPLARSFDRVTAVEFAPSAHGDLEANAASQKGRASRIQAVNRTAEAYLDSARGQWDFAVVDPPRAGLGPRAAKSLTRLAIPRMAYVACDPATLARDLAVLVAAGYRVEQAHLVDLFPQSYHMETVLHLAR
jgi:23S rRNA (uracil1939-C5)-methyltransferase